MSFSIKCDRCKNHFEVDDTLELRYWKQSIGHYATIHLCKGCHTLFEKFLRHADEKPCAPSESAGTLGVDERTYP